MGVVACPQCGARVRKPEEGKPICPRCGYGKRAPGQGVVGTRPISATVAAVLLFLAALGGLLAIVLGALTVMPLADAGWSTDLRAWLLIAWGVPPLLGVPAGLGILRRRSSGLNLGSGIAIVGLLSAIALGAWAFMEDGLTTRIVSPVVSFAYWAAVVYMLYLPAVRDWFRPKLRGGPVGSSMRSAFGDPRAGGKMDLPISMSGHVLSPAGRRRDPVQVLLLMAGTLGLYWFFWALQAFQELSTLHRRHHPVILFLLGLPLPPVMLTYLFMEVAYLEEYRKQRNMAPGITVWSFMLWFVLGLVALAAALAVMTIWLQWTTAGIVVVSGGAAVFLGMVAWTHFRVQRSMNQVWNHAGVTG